MDTLLQKLRAAYPTVRLVPGPVFSWSPATQTITYGGKKHGKVATWSLLHEVAHAALEHGGYETDFELLLLEVAAWHKAKELGEQYGLAIDEEHIQDCLDTYRDWLDQRSTCPLCSNTSLQQNAVTYCCFNCGTSWTVTASRFCRPYRLTTKQQKTPPGGLKHPQTTFL